jgi:hypothetical protein
MISPFWGLLSIIVVGMCGLIVGLLLYAEGERNERDYERTMGKP